MIKRTVKSVDAEILSNIEAYRDQDPETADLLTAILFAKTAKTTSISETASSLSSIPDTNTTLVPPVQLGFENGLPSYTNPVRQTLYLPPNLPSTPSIYSTFQYNSAVTVLQQSSRPVYNPSQTFTNPVQTLSLVSPMQHPRTNSIVTNTGFPPVSTSPSDVHTQAPNIRTANIVQSLATVSSKPLISVARRIEFSSPSSRQQEILPLEVLPSQQVSLEPPTPPKWIEAINHATFDVSLPYTLTQVNMDSEEWRVLQTTLFAGVSVTKIERIVNPRLWKRFVETRKELLGIKATDLKLLSGLLSEQEAQHRHHVNTTYAKASHFENIPYSDNVALLCHGTKTTNLKVIFEEGLDERLGSSISGLLGRGIYFADSPQKSMKYDVNKVILVFVVLLGDCLNTGNLPDKNSFVREPRKHQFQQRNPDDLFFDSICGRPAGDNEYVIYNRNHCCPMYAVHYESTMCGDDPYVSTRRTIPPFAWEGIKDTLSISSKQKQIRVKPRTKSGSDGIWPFLAENIFPLMHSNRREYERQYMEVFQHTHAQPSVGSSATAEDKEDCTICCVTYPSVSSTLGSILWKTLDCGHFLCVDCYNTMEKHGVTMSGMSHSSMKCPFCNSLTGIEVGSCPNGTMEVYYYSTSVAGHENFGTIKITYDVPRTSGKYHLHRDAYLPNSPEGTRVLGLLQTAWDRRLCFQIGTSITSGAKDVLCWNIHHKTAMGGGTSSYGYPDPTYLMRVTQELKDFGIE